MNPPQIYMCSPSWPLLPPPSPFHPSGSSQCTSPKHPVSCIEPGLATHFIHDILHDSMPFSQIFPPSPSPTESIRLFYTSVSLLLCRTQGYCYLIFYLENSLSFHIFVLKCIPFPQFEKPIFLGLPYTLFSFPVQIGLYTTLLGEVFKQWSPTWVPRQNAGTEQRSGLWDIKYAIGVKSSSKSKINNEC